MSSFFLNKGNEIPHGRDLVSVFHICHIYGMAEIDVGKMNLFQRKMIQYLHVRH